MNKPNPAPEPAPTGLMTVGALIVAPRLIGIPKTLRRATDFAAILKLMFMFLPAKPATPSKPAHPAQKQKSRKRPERRAHSHRKDPLPKARKTAHPAGGLDHVQDSGSGPMEGIPGATPVR